MEIWHYVCRIFGGQQETTSSVQDAVIILVRACQIVQAPHQWSDGRLGAANPGTYWWTDFMLYVSWSDAEVTKKIKEKPITQVIWTHGDTCIWTVYSCTFDPIAQGAFQCLLSGHDSIIMLRTEFIVAYRCQDSLYWRLYDWTLEKHRLAKALLCQKNLDD